MFGMLVCEDGHVFYVKYGKTLATSNYYAYLCKQKPKHSVEVINTNSIMARERNYYWVNCCTTGGFCYKSHYNCSWKDVIRFRQIAKLSKANNIFPRTIIM